MSVEEGFINSIVAVIKPVNGGFDDVARRVAKMAVDQNDMCWRMYQAGRDDGLEDAVNMVDELWGLTASQMDSLKGRLRRLKVKP
jgi:hypothetical protein